MQVVLPPIFRISSKEAGSSIRQFAAPTSRYDADVEAISGRRHGLVITPADGSPPLHILSGSSKPELPWTHVIRSPNTSVPNDGAVSFDVSTAIWLRHPKHLALSDLSSYESHCTQVRDSWINAFTYKEEDANRNIYGLRLPQIGAIHGVHAHWAVSGDPATIVLPTGVGKTETMLSLLVTGGCSRVMVVVPTDVLRTQLSERFITLGLLKVPQYGILSDAAQYPVVGILRSRPTTTAQVDSLFRKCNVIVTTMPLASQCAPEVMERMAALTSHLFIDEAHHVAAPTWDAFRKCFVAARIVQFTATPYRNDNRPVAGTRAFTFPLRAAQQQGYFTRINFKPVVEFDPARKDAAIAEAAVAQLRSEPALGHILMARAANVSRANEIFDHYRCHTEFNPVQLHTGITSRTERESIRSALVSGQSRIVVCVDMLGEGFDLPELKIAAFHDIRKTLAVTLQLAGRFTRAKPHLGHATFIANIADVDVKDELKRLYRHDTDWNALLPMLGDATSEGELSLGQFLEGFESLPDDISLRNVRPAMSMAAYHTSCTEWTPENFSDGMPGFDALDRVYHTLNSHENTLVVVTAKRTAVDWAQIDEIHTWDWQLYVLHWDPDRKLLFIHNSSNAGFFKRLAQAVAGEVVQVRGPKVFRCLAGVNRLRFQNIGLLIQLGHLISYEMRAGPDVESGMSEAQKHRAVKANLFGQGFENGHRTTIGCSYKGRIWSYRKANLRQLMTWCRSIGQKLTDDSLDPETVLRGTLEPQLVDSRPQAMPIAVEWPELFYKEPERVFEFQIGQSSCYMHEANLELVNPSVDGDLGFAVTSGDRHASFALALLRRNNDPDYQVVPLDGAESHINWHGSTQSLRDFFEDHPPTLWFADGSSLRGCEHVALRRQPDPFPTERIQAWDWKGTNIRRESQGPQRDSTTIQHRVIAEIRKVGGYVVLFDDDDHGESADVVAIAERDTFIDVAFWHCKYSGDDKPGHRIADLYEVCGQTQKSVRWLDKVTDLFTHLLRREPRRERNRETTRFELGTTADLLRIRDKADTQQVKLRVTIVQPGLSKAKVSKEQLELLAVTDNYLVETFAIPLAVVASS